MYITLVIFSPPELKAQVRFSDRLLSIARPSVCKLFTFSSFSPEPLGQFQEIWHKASLGEGDQVYSNDGPCPFPRGDNNEIAN